MSWEQNLINDRHGIADLLKNSKVVAVLGMKRDENQDKPAYAVPMYLKAHGYDIIPLPVKYPEVKEVAGLHAYQTLAEIPSDVDIVDVFRAPRDIDRHVADILAKKPKAVWFQSGIRNDSAAEKLARAGIKVVQDRCMKVELARLRAYMAHHPE